MPHGWRVVKNLEYLERLALALGLDVTFDHVEDYYTISDGTHTTRHDYVRDAEEQLLEWRAWVAEEEAVEAGEFGLF